MLLDKQLELSNAQAITGTVVSTNTIDLTIQQNGVAAGKAMAILLAIGTVSNGTVAPVISVQTDNLDTFGSPTVIQSRTLATTDLVAGRYYYIALNPEYNVERFLRLSIVAGASNFLLDAYLIPQDDQSRYVAFPGSVTIL
jgi:hypothetical protein